MFAVAAPASSGQQNILLGFSRDHIINLNIVYRESERYICKNIYSVYIVYIYVSFETRFLFL